MSTIIMSVHRQIVVYIWSASLFNGLQHLAADFVAQGLQHSTRSEEKVWSLKSIACKLYT